MSTFANSEDPSGKKDLYNINVIYRIWCTFKAVLAQPILEQPKNKIG